MVSGRLGDPVDRGAGSGQFEPVPPGSPHEVWMRPARAEDGGRVLFLVEPDGVVSDHETEAARELICRSGGAVGQHLGLGALPSPSGPVTRAR
ncbi:hypothetical protein GCM10027445_30620 [Amycolatopsis endophytica]